MDAEQDRDGDRDRSRLSADTRERRSTDGEYFFTRYYLKIDLFRYTNVGH